MKRIRPYGSKMQAFIDQWDATDHQGKVQLCQNHGITYQTGKSWRQLPADDEPFRPNLITPPARGEVIQAPQRRSRPNVPLNFQIGTKPKVIAALCDTHNPFQDEVALALVEGFLKELQPDFILYNGDSNDFYQLSKFDKNPGRINKLQDDLDDTKAMFSRHREICPNSIMKFIDGNHEYRLEKFLWVNVNIAISLTSK